MEGEYGKFIQNRARGGCKNDEGTLMIFSVCGTLVTQLPL